MGRKSQKLQKKSFFRRQLPIFILALLIVTGYFAWQYLEGEKPTPTPETTPMSDETLNWKIYRHELYGFELRYPKDWQLEEDFDYFNTSNPILKIRKTTAEDKIEKCIENTTREEKTSRFCLSYSPYLDVFVGSAASVNAQDYLTEECRIIIHDISACFFSIIGDTVIDGVKGKIAESCTPTANLQQKTVIRNGYVYRLATPAKCINALGSDYPENQKLVEFFDEIDKDYRDTLNQIISTFRFLR